MVVVEALDDDLVGGEGLAQGRFDLALTVPPFDEAFETRLPWGFGISWRKRRSLSEQEVALVEHCVSHARRLAARGVEGFVAG